MKKDNIQYGVLDIPAQTVICKLEKGGDRDNKATYRFAMTGRTTKKRHIALVTNETLMTDFYNAKWAHIPFGWVKAEDKITWFNSYKEAAQEKASRTNRKQIITRTILIIMLIAAIAFIAYKIYKHKNTFNNPINIDINDIPME